ncbi:MAG TPA: hypothetical protein DC049_15875, partial [Spirochaetia bacterium]|nr:hypothetical protein [Spirochaetia bacterium]
MRIAAGKRAAGETKDVRRMREANRQQEGTSEPVYCQYDGDNMFRQYNTNNEITAEYTMTRGIDDPLFVKKNGSNYVYVKNHQGSIEGLVSGGQMLGTNKYTAYGDERTNVGNTDSEFGYTGREEIQGSETGMYYYRSRLYSSKLMSFMREDDYYKGMMQAQNETGLESRNWYQYVAGNPVMNNDPMG